MADGEPQLKRNLNPGVLFSLRTGSTQSWKEAGIRLVRATSTSHCGSPVGWLGWVALHGCDWSVTGLSCLPHGPR